MKKINKNLKLLITILLVIIGIYLLNSYGLNQIQDKIESMGPISPIGLFILRAVSIIIPALPSTGYSLLAGALLGFKKGLFTIALADILSCSLSFYLSRKYGRGIVEKLAGERFLTRLDKININHIENNLFRQKLLQIL